MFSGAKRLQHEQMLQASLEWKRNRQDSRLESEILAAFPDGRGEAKQKGRAIVSPGMDGGGQVGVKKIKVFSTSLREGGNAGFDMAGKHDANLSSMSGPWIPNTIHDRHER